MLIAVIVGSSSKVGAIIYTARLPVYVNNCKNLLHHGQQEQVVFERAHNPNRYICTTVTVWIEDGWYKCICYETKICNKVL